MINPPMIKQPSWKKGKLVTPAAVYSAKLKVAVKRTIAAAAIIVANVFFMICYLLGNVFICFYTNEICVPDFQKNKITLAIPFEVAT
jgi:hypothetical protein